MMAIPKEIQTKYDILCDIIREKKRVAVAFSAGVDSTFLLKVSRDILGEDAVAITMDSVFFKSKEKAEAVDFCERANIHHILCHVDILQSEYVYSNPVNRCYYCKRQMFEAIWEVARHNDIEHLLEGSNMDDTKDYRPGRVALQELGVESPLCEARLYKDEIRLLSKSMELPTYNKPSFACLASRIAYKEEITKEKLDMVEQAENVLEKLGFLQFRVRMHSDLARIEVDESDFIKMSDKEVRNHIYESLQRIGFSYVSLDLRGYRTGSMNEVL